MGILENIGWLENVGNRGVDKLGMPKVDGFVSNICKVERYIYYYY